MAESKTRPTDASVADFIASVADSQRREDAAALVPIFERVTGAPATMWGSAIIGFGKYRYRYESGTTGEACRVGFAPRKAELVLYVGAARPEQAANLARLGKHKTGKGCVYVKRLSDVDGDALADLIRTAFAAEPMGYVAE